MPLVMTNPRPVVFAHDSYHVVFTFNDTTEDAIFYTNGTAKDTVNFPYTVDQPDGAGSYVTPRIGSVKQVNDSVFWSGYLQDVAVYDFVLSPERIAAHYAAGASTVADYETTVLADSPAAYWRLGESSGTTAVDSSGNGEDLDYVDTPTLGQPGIVPSDSGTSVLFNGTSELCRGPSETSYFNFVNLSIEAWVQPDDLSGPRCIFHHGDTGASSTDQGYWLTVATDGSIRFTTLDGTFVQAASIAGLVTVP